MKSDQSAVRGGISNSRPGLGQSGLGAAGGQRLPVAPRERKPALAALAVLLILGGALTSAYLVMASGQRVSAIMIVKPVAAGQQIPVDAMREVQIGDTGIKFVNWSHRDAVARTYAAVPLSPDTLLTSSMTVTNSSAHKGRLIIGLALKPGQFPTSRDLAVGKRVSVYAVGGNGSGGGGLRAGTVLSTDALVVELSQGGDDDRLRGDQTTVDIAVLPGEAPQITQAASAGAVAIALIPDGTRVPGGSAPPPTNEKPAKPNNGTNPSPGGSQSPDTGGN